MPVSALFALAALGGAPVSPMQADDFQWRQVLAAGKTIEIVGINGSIEASGTGGREVVVEAVKRGRRSDPGTVRIEVVEHADGVTICAVYPDVPRRGANECRQGGKGRNSKDKNDVQVTWTIRVPDGVRFVGRSVNGDVAALRLSADAEAHTVNGDISLETSSWARGSTVNGSIDAKLGRADWRGDVEFDTVNGRITVDLPAGADVEVDASTVNGSMSTEFPLTIRGKWGPRHMSGTIGQGGRSLSLTTVNGNMNLRRSQ